LVNLRLLRILRLQRVLQDLETFARFQTALGLKVRKVQNYQLQLARVVLSLFTLVSVSTGLIYTFEHVVNPQIPDYFTALYFGLTTLTTVGFGDITPITPEGKLIVSGSILAGVAIIPAQAASLVEALYERQTGATPGRPPRDGMVDMRNRCPTCGVAFHWSDACFCWSCGGEL
jgi:voltage-gated potassium channel